MLRLEKWLDELLLAGRLSFLKREALEGLGMTSVSFNAAAGRLLAKGRIAKPRTGFFVIVRPEDRMAGPDPVLWLDALMAFLNLDYRVSFISITGCSLFIASITVKRFRAHRPILCPRLF